MNLKAILKKIYSFLFLAKNNSLDWIKILINISLPINIIYYLEIIYDISQIKNRGLFLRLVRGEGIEYLGYLILCCIIAFIIFILSIISRSRIIFYINLLLFLPIVFLYRLITEFCETPICYLNPLWYFSLFFSFIIVFHKFRYFKELFLFLIILPSSIIIIDDIYGRLEVNKFYKTCHHNFGTIQYNPIHLSKEYFEQSSNNNNRPYIYECRRNDTFALPTDKKGIILLNTCDIYFVESNPNFSWNDYKILEYFKTYSEFQIYEIKKTGATSTLVSIIFRTMYRKPNDLSLILGTKLKVYSCVDIFENNQTISNLIPIDSYIQTK